MRNQDGSQDLETNSDLVPSLSDEEISVAQKRDPELCRFMELLHEHSVKPNSKLLTAEPTDVKVLCWYEFRLQDEILYRTGKKVDDEWRIVIPRVKWSEILSFLHDSKFAGYPGMSRNDHRFKILLATHDMRH